MATEDQHLARARSNEAFAKGLSTIDAADWKVIASFYSALHYVEAIVARNGYRSSDHKSRSAYLNVVPELRSIRADYLTLGNWAWKARYDPAINLSKEKTIQEICDLLDVVRTGLGF